MGQGYTELFTMDSMLLFYTLIMYLLAPFLLIRLWWKGRKLPAYRKRIWERFSIGTHVKPADVWIHAVSLGEVIAASPLIDALVLKNYRVLVTTMTPTGSERVMSGFANTVSHQYIPYDLPWAIKRFFKKTSPKVGVIIETELWPNLINQAHAFKIPMFLANARLSERSWQGYMRFRFLFHPILNKFSEIFSQSEEDATRFIHLGAKRVRVMGNMKFDIQTDLMNPKPFEALSLQWGSERTVVIAASTHEDEESQILAHLDRLQKAIPKVILLIAPRHPERFQSVYQRCKSLGFNTGLKSARETLNQNNDVVVLDSLGELLGFFKISHFAFVGGSLVDKGGHNVLEPIALKIPVFTGSYVHHFKAICNELEKEHALVIVNTAHELISKLIELHRNVELQKQMVKNATMVLERNKGSVLKHLEEIERFLLTPK